MLLTQLLGLCLLAALLSDESCAFETVFLFQLLCLGNNHAYPLLLLWSPNLLELLYQCAEGVVQDSLFMASPAVTNRCRNNL